MNHCTFQRFCECDGKIKWTFFFVDKQRHLKVPLQTSAKIYQHTFTGIIIFMTKLLNSDWLRAVQFKRNTTAKSVTMVQKV